MIYMCVSNGLAPAQWWDIFRQARQGDAHYQAVCARYSQMLQGAYAQYKADRAYEEEMVCILAECSESAS